MGLGGKLKRAKDIASSGKTALTSTPKAASAFGKTLYSEGKKAANTPGSGGQRFADSPGGFTAFTPKAVRTAASFVLPTPRGVVNSQRKAAQNPSPRNIAGAAYDVATIAAAPLAVSGAARAPKAASAFARSPRFGALVADLSGDLGAVGAKGAKGAKLRTAADLAMSRSRVPKSAPGAAVASATARLEAAASGAAAPIVNTTTKAADVAPRVSKASKLGGFAARTVKGAFVDPIKDVGVAASRVKNAKGILGKSKAIGKVGLHTPGWAARTLPVAAATAGAILETKNTAQDTFRGNKVGANSGIPNTKEAQGLSAVAKVYEVKGQAGVDALTQGLSDAKADGLMDLVTKSNDRNPVHKIVAEKKAKDLLRAKVKARYKTLSASPTPMPY